MFKYLSVCFVLVLGGGIVVVFWLGVFCVWLVGGGGCLGLFCLFFFFEQGNIIGKYKFVK